MTTDTTEKGLESLIMRHLTGVDGFAVEPGYALRETPAEYAAAKAAGSGWIAGSPADYDRAHALDVPQLFRFLEDTQPDALKRLGISDYRSATDIKRLKFLTRLSSEIGKHGVIHMLRKGHKHEACDFALFYGTPSEGNATAAALFAKNRFSVTRQLRYSTDQTRRALDLCLFINGLPIATFELKNSLTKQTVEDAVEQYKRDRDPREKLFEFGRCVVHFAVDDADVRMCTHLQGNASWFLPFNKGHDDGAGNPPNPNGLKTDYLWKEILTPAGLTDILENYAQIVETKNPKTGKVTRTQIFPRYHQLDVVRKALADAAACGAGQRYLIQHSAGSGKSNSIAWLAHQLIRVPSPQSCKSCNPVQKESPVPSSYQPNSQQPKPLQPTASGLQPPLFSSVIVVTDRTILDDQIQKTVKQFMQVSATVGHANHSGDLRKFIESGKKIIISTVQKFPFILDEIERDEAAKSFAIIIDEAHSSQGGKTSSAMSKALSDADTDSEEDAEDTVNAALESRIASRKMLANASYFAFTATPKNKTLEMFGEALPPDAEGKTKHRPFHSYTMKQAIQEGFILDVLANYTPVFTYCKLVKTVEDDPEFDTRKALKKLRKYVEGHDHAIRLKTEIMVDHFHDYVLRQNKIGGKARAMVVCNGIARALQYFHAFQAYLEERKSPFRALVAFSGEHEDAGVNVTETSLNKFPSSEIADRFREEPYRFLICADKFQTGYDEPLLHTMYVDKPLSGIKAVQTLSRLNRARPGKRDVFVLDFQNDTEMIKESFAPYYRTTFLGEETDPNKLHDLKSALDAAQVYAQEQVDTFAERFLLNAPRETLDPILDTCVNIYATTLDEDGQIDFKGKAKAFVRTYEFLGSILPFKNREWEKLSILLTLLVPKLPSPIDEDLSKGVIQAIDMDSYRVEKKAAMKIPLPDENAEIGPVPVEGGGHKPEPQLDPLSKILDAFNAHFAGLFTDADRVIRRIREDIAPKVAADEAYQNAKANTPSTARLEHDKALEKIMLTLLKDDTQVYKQFVQNDAFKRAVSDMVYALTQANPINAA